MPASRRRRVVCVCVCVCERERERERERGERASERVRDRVYWETLSITNVTDHAHICKPMCWHRA